MVHTTSHRGGNVPAKSTLVNFITFECNKHMVGSFITAPSPVVIKRNKNCIKKWNCYNELMSNKCLHQENTFKIKQLQVVVNSMILEMRTICDLHYRLAVVSNLVDNLPDSDEIKESLLKTKADISRCETSLCSLDRYIACMQTIQSRWAMEKTLYGDVQERSGLALETICNSHIRELKEQLMQLQCELTANKYEEMKDILLIESGMSSLNSHLRDICGEINALRERKNRLERERATIRGLSNEVDAACAMSHNITSASMSQEAIKVPLDYEELCQEKCRLMNDIKNSENRLRHIVESFQSSKAKATPLKEHPLVRRVFQGLDRSASGDGDGDVELTRDELALLESAITAEIEDMSDRCVSLTQNRRKIIALDPCAGDDDNGGSDGGESASKQLEMEILTKSEILAELQSKIAIVSIISSR